jgi:hypothetical protein
VCFQLLLLLEVEQAETLELLEKMVVQVVVVALVADLLQQAQALLVKDMLVAQAQP